MRYRRSRLRRVLKWAGLVASVSLTVLFVASLFLMISFCSSTYGGVVTNGDLFAVWGGTRFVPSGWQCVRVPFDEIALTLAPSWELMSGYAGIHAVQVPLSPGILALAVPTAILWWRDRRPPKGHCQDCGYDLRGQKDPRCPECGKPFDVDLLAKNVKQRP